MKSNKSTLTLLTYVALALALTSAVAAEDVSRREHGQLNRMLKKRALAPVIGVAPAPSETATSAISSTTSSSATTAAVTSTGVSTGPTTSTDSTTTSSATDTTSTTATTDTASTSSSSVTTSSTSTSTTTSSTTTSTSTTSSTPATTSTTSSATSTTPLNLQPVTSAASATTHQSTLHVTSTLTQDDTAATSTTGSSGSTSSSAKVAKTTVTILIAIAASIGGLAIVWTIIRKWKFKPSKDFEDRMAPIDWNPSEGSGFEGVPGSHRRGPSNASSFHSGSGHEDNAAGRGVGGGYGAGSNDGHGVPEHDFTAGPAHLAPVGGYADLARGASPQPQMSEAHGNYGYGDAYAPRY